jgi:ribose transport system permease protein
MVGRVPFPVILAGIFVMAAWYLINRTKFGRYVLSVGSYEGEVYGSGSVKMSLLRK